MQRKNLSYLAMGALSGIVVLGLTTANAVQPGFTEDRSAALAEQIDPAKPQSVILLIGDGTDDSMITAARN